MKHFSKYVYIIYPGKIRELAGDWKNYGVLSMEVRGWLKS